MNEDNFYELLDATKLCEKTKTGYITMYKRFVSTEEFKNGISNVDEDVIINFIDNMKTSYASKYIMGYIAIFVKAPKELPFEKIQEKRVFYNIKRNEKALDNCKRQNEMNIGYDKLKSFIEEQRNIVREELKTAKKITKNMIIYVINFLIFEFNVRNKDIDVFITDNELFTQSKHLNYLLVRNDDVLYIRNVYKTSKIYGTKEHVIKNIEIMEICKIWNYRYLLCTSKGMHAKTDSLSSYVFSRTFMKLGESKIFKIIVKEALKKDDPIGAVEELCKSRGSSINEIVTNYNLNVYKDKKMFSFNLNETESDSGDDN